MQHPREPFSSDDPADDAAAPGGADRGGDPPPPPLPQRTYRTGHQPGGEFSRPRSSPRPPTGPAGGMPLPAPAAPPAPLIPPETHHDEAGPPPSPPSPSSPSEPPVEAGFPSGSQVLFESWEPPYELTDPWWDVSLPPEFGDVPVGALAGSADDPPAGGRAGTRTGPPPPRGPGGRPQHRPGGPYWDGPRHARRPGRGRDRRRDRGHLGGAILALTGALALAGAIPLGILGVRTLSGQPTPTVSTAPMADGSQIKAPASAPAGAPSQVSQGQTAMGPGPSSAASSSPSASAASSGAASSGAASGAKAATLAVTAGPGCRSVNGVIVFPFHAPAGDGWAPATAERSGPCGTSFTYSLLANVKDASGDWHDHYAWIFSTGRKVASCTMSFYIPPSAHANSSAFYWFSTGSDNPENRMGDFSIDQKATQGQWVTKGPLTFPGGTVLVELTDRGVGPVQDSVEAGVVQLRCV